METKKIETAVELDNVSFEYEEGKSTLSNISFKVKRNEYCALIGHNGSGKSTIAKLIIGLLVQNKGDIKIFDEVMTDDNVLALRKNIGIVFQNPDNQFIGSTVKDDIAFGLENDCIEEDKMASLVKEYASKVNMEAFLDKEPSALSGGQKQRVAIAGTLVRHPKIIVMDESTSMLDPKGKREIRKIIMKMRKEYSDLTIISITHDIEEAYSSDHVIVLDKGRKVMDGTPEEVFSNTEKLREINLDIPFYKELNEELKKYDVNIDGVTTLEGLEERLCQ